MQVEVFLHTLPLLVVRMMKYASRIFLIIFIQAATLNIVLACFCEEDEIETVNFDKYDELFLGKVIKIERIEATSKHGDETYTFVGTITSFEVLKKWRGNYQRVIKVYQEDNSCAVPFHISSQRWIVSGYKKKFVQKDLRRKFPGLHLQTSVCSIVIGERGYEEFNSKIDKLDYYFPDAIDLKQRNKLWIWIVSGILSIRLLLFLIYNKKKRPKT